jgi:hypothetical protein
VEEVDLDAAVQLALAVQLEERELHRVVVLVRRAVCRRVGFLECALVDVRRDADAEPVRDRVERRPATLGGVQERLPQRQQRPGRLLAGARDRAVVGDRDALALEECLAGTVRRGGPVETDVDVRRVPRHRRVELGPRRKTDVGLGGGRGPEVVGVEAADGGDPRAARDAPRAGGVDLLDVRDRVGVLERGVVARPVAHQDDVVVVVDDARHHRAASEVDGAASAWDASVDLDEAPVADHHAGDDAVLGVHRVDLAVVEDELRVLVARLPGPALR